MAIGESNLITHHWQPKGVLARELGQDWLLVMLVVRVYRWGASIYMNKRLSSQEFNILPFRDTYYQLMRLWRKYRR